MTLTKEQQQGVRKLYVAGECIHVIAELYGVSYEQIMDIILGGQSK
ncbi:hypothetical protein [Ktedonobacter robiniae]|uniref:Helix-turn-helix domain-containing protein n=1 Tax=Ktedonobacter robiniae TaxID=2778365 RepID=A0ABQ3US21_9CHLR|nr:hypothetical protein [Ktedonobacter robiniae]GHO55486.1 hypothetical protein KSB_39610 [Ktedonobacter robiniae]